MEEQPAGDPLAQDEPGPTEAGGEARLEDENRPTAHASSLGEQGDRLIHVVQHVDEAHRTTAVGGQGQPMTVEEHGGLAGHGQRAHVDPVDPPRTQGLLQVPRAAAHVEERIRGREVGSQAAGDPLGAMPEEPEPDASQ